jgi:hypothetical protein
MDLGRIDEFNSRGGTIGLVVKISGEKAIELPPKEDISLDFNRLLV